MLLYQNTKIVLGQIYIEDSEYVAKNVFKIANYYRKVLYFIKEKVK